MHPALSVSEEYTDNVYETGDNKRYDYITRAQPGLAMKYIAPLWDWDLAYNLDYRYYARNSRTDDITHNALFTSLVEISDEVLFLEVKDAYKRVPLDVTRDTSNESLYLNQSDQNIGSVSPYLVLRPAANFTLKSGYRYINTWYRDSSAVSKEDHVGFLSASYELSAKMFVTTDYTFTWEIPERGSRFYRHEGLIGPRYEYADKSYIYAQGGIIASDYDSGANVENPAWKAGVIHSFDTVTASLIAGTSYVEDPQGTTTFTTSYNVSLAKKMQRGTMALAGSYKEYEDGITEHKKNKSYSGIVSSALELSPRIKGNLAFTYERYATYPYPLENSLLEKAYTDRYFLDSSISWLAGESMTLNLAYKFIDYNSDDFADDNKRINRVIFEAMMSF